ncbi:hypothetical protein FDB41_12405 [Clostridium botulinum]|nr:hypothetical protein [Clostridium botulinum]NFO54332.1 hypothetical protein [Clostridium botulinum]
MSTDEFDILLEDVKDYLHISWKDKKTDKNITGMIRRGMAHLNKIAGVPNLDYTIDDLPKELLLDYVRYANSQALEVFETNFQSELLSLHLEYQAKGEHNNED